MVNSLPPRRRARKNVIPPLNVVPAFVTQETCREVLGINRRAYLEQIVPLCTKHLVKIGSMRILPLERVRERFAELSAANESEVDRQIEAATDGPATVDEVLAKIGRRAVWGAQ